MATLTVIENAVKNLNKDFYKELKLTSVNKKKSKYTTWKFSRSGEEPITISSSKRFSILRQYSKKSAYWF